jgi:hypothetical protein
MKYDRAAHEGLILLASDKRRGTWAGQMILNGQRTLRLGGQLPTTMTNHGLLSVALATMLRGITRVQAERLAADAGVRKPRLLVATMDQSFADALRAKITQDATTGAAKPLRIGKNFVSLAAAQVARFDLTLTTPEETDKTILVLRDWAMKMLPSPTLLASVPASLAPTAVSQVVNEY